MWTLFVISISPYFNDPKITRYEEFTSLWNCDIARIELEETFTNGEVSICMQTGKVIPSPHVIY